MSDSGWVGKAALACLGFATAMMPSGLGAQAVGLEFQANVYTTNHQFSPAIAANGSGRFVIVWQSDWQDGEWGGIFARVFEADGTPATGELQVNTYTDTDEWSPAVAMDEQGRFLVVWERGHDAELKQFKGRRFDSAGVPLSGEFVVSTYTGSDHLAAAAATNADGETVVVWWAPYDSQLSVLGRRFDADGTPIGNEFVINTQAQIGRAYPAVAPDSAGNFLVVWQNADSEKFSEEIFAQRIDPAGNRIGPEIPVNVVTAGPQWLPKVAVSPDDWFLVVWHSESQPGDAWDIYGRVFNPTGSPWAGEFQVNTYTTFSQRYPEVAPDGVGGFVVVWGGYGPGDESNAVRAQRLDARGRRIGGEFPVHLMDGAAERNLSSSGAGSGNLVAAWSRLDGSTATREIFGRRLTIAVFADGFELGDSCEWSATTGGSC